VTARRSAERLGVSGFTPVELSNAEPNATV
jgi:hypothetical protein